MTTLREAAQQALEALKDVDGPITALLGGLLGSPDTDAPGAKVRAAINALRAALAQEQAEPVQKPVAWMWEETARRSSTGIGGIDRKLLFCRPADEPWKRNITPLYTAPPKAKPLTDADMLDIIDAAMEGGSLLDLVRAVEKKVRGE